MSFFKKPIIFLAVALFGLTSTGHAQYQFTVDPFFSYFKDLKRYDIGFTAVLPAAQYVGVVPVYSGNMYVGDSNAHHPQAGTGIGGSIGLSIPFKATGHISCWAVNFHIFANMYTWSDLNETMTTDGSYHPKTPTLSATTLQVGVPIGIDFKAGNDAIESRRLALGTSLGVGVMPNYCMTSLSPTIDGVNTHGAFGFNPYAKVEFGFLLGIDFKIRVMYTLGDVTLIDVNKPSDPPTNGPFKVTSTGNLMVSLVLMPFSVGWYERSWFTTHDTYNRYDRLN